MTTPGTTDDLAIAAEETPAGAALAAGLDAVARVHDDALDRIAHLAETWDQPEEEARVLRMPGLPTVTTQVEAAAAA